MAYENIINEISFVDEEGQTIYSALRIKSEIDENGSTIFKINNLGNNAYTNLGVFIRPSTNLGPWDYPADSPPGTDYQDLLTWGSKSEATGELGGLKIFTDPFSDDYQYVTRHNGSTFLNRIKVGALPQNNSTSVKIEFEVPEGVDSRRLYIDIVVG